MQSSAATSVQASSSALAQSSAAATETIGSGAVVNGEDAASSSTDIAAVQNQIAPTKTKPTFVPVTATVDQDNVQKIKDQIQVNYENDLKNSNDPDKAAQYRDNDLKQINDMVDYANQKLSASVSPMTVQKDQSLNLSDLYTGLQFAVSGSLDDNGDESDTTALIPSDGSTNIFYSKDNPYGGLSTMYDTNLGSSSGDYKAVTYWVKQPDTSKVGNTTGTIGIDYYLGTNVDSSNPTKVTTFTFDVPVYVRDTSNDQVDKMFPNENRASGSINYNVIDESTGNVLMSYKIPRYDLSKLSDDDAQAFHDKVWGDAKGFMADIEKGILLPNGYVPTDTTDSINYGVGLLVSTSIDNVDSLANDSNGNPQDVSNDINASVYVKPSGSILNANNALIQPEMDGNNFADAFNYVVNPERYPQGTTFSWKTAPETQRIETFADNADSSKISMSYLKITNNPEITATLSDGTTKTLTGDALTNLYLPDVEYGANLFPNELGTTINYKNNVVTVGDNVQDPSAYLDIDSMYDKYQKYMQDSEQEPLSKDVFAKEFKWATPPDFSSAGYHYGSIYHTNKNGEAYSGPYSMAFDVQPKSNTKTITRTINITDPDGNKQDPVIQKVTFTSKNPVIYQGQEADPEMVSDNDVWPSIDVAKEGYTASGDVPEVTVTPDMSDQVINITYTKDKPADNTPTDKPDKPADSTPTDKPVGNTDKPVDKPDKPADNTDKPADNTDKPVDKPADNTDKPVDKPVDNTDKPAEQPADKPVDKPADNTDKPAQKPTEKPAKKVAKATPVATAATTNNGNGGSTGVTASGSTSSEPADTQSYSGGSRSSLPQTGNNTETSALLSAAGAMMASVIAVLGAKRRKHD